MTVAELKGLFMALDTIARFPWETEAARVIAERAIADVKSALIAEDKPEIDRAVCAHDVPIDIFMRRHS
jgi:hypothetical protein